MGVYRDGQAPDTLRDTLWYTLRHGLWACDDLRFDERCGISLA